MPHFRTTLCSIEETDGTVPFHEMVQDQQKEETINTVSSDEEETENEDPVESKFNGMIMTPPRLLRRSPRASDLSFLLSSIIVTSFEEAKETTESLDHNAVVVNDQKRRRRIAKMFERIRTRKTNFSPSKLAVPKETATPLSKKIDFVPRNIHDEVEKIQMERDIGRGVSFGSVCVQYYPMTLGDNPSVSSGPPIQLDWCHSEESRTQLDEYELGRHRSFYRETLPTRMSVNKRMDIGIRAGYTWREVVKHSKEVKQFKREKLERRRKEIKQETERAERKEAFVEIWI
eukprot:scaffold3023_cov50-Attheya_sp.AAC.3